MSLNIIHTNDFHGTLTAHKAEYLRRLKDQLEALFFDTGDCIKTGNLGFPLRREPAWELLGQAGCDASVLGNRETHVVTSAFKAKIEGHLQPIVVANMRCRDGSKPLPEHVVFKRHGLAVGVFGLMVPMVTEKMKTQAASTYLWDFPLPVARRKVEELRTQVDCLIALTHIGSRQDDELALQCPEIDIILGGHSHTVLHAPKRLGDTFICQGGSHGKFVGSYSWASRGELSGGLLALP